MPVGGGTSNGSYPTTTANPSVFKTLTFAGAETQTTDILHADGLPQLNAWFRQTAGAGVVTVTLQFADGRIIAGMDWQALVAPYGIISGVSSLRNEPLGSPHYRASLTSTDAATVRYRLTASLG